MPRIMILERKLRQLQKFRGQWKLKQLLQLFLLTAWALAPWTVWQKTFKICTFRICHINKALNWIILLSFCLSLTLLSFILYSPECIIVLKDFFILFSLAMSSVHAKSYNFKPQLQKNANLRTWVFKWQIIHTKYWPMSSSVHCSACHPSQ